MTHSFTIDRKSAAELLQVSVRTLDRYLKSKKLAFIKKDRSVYISQEDIVNLMKDKNLKVPFVLDPKIKNIAKGADSRISEIVEDNEETITSEVSSEHKYYHEDDINSYQKKQPENNYYEGNIIKESTKLEDKIADSLDFYKNLYEVTKSDLDDKVQQLNKLTFRLGQLESQVNSMIPLVEYKKQEKLLSETTSRYQEALGKERIKAKQNELSLLREIDEKEKALNNYASKIKEYKHQIYLEEKNKHVFAILTFLALVALPIVWLALK